MLDLLRWTALGVAALAAASCVSYEARPLDPAAELLALKRRDVADVVVEHARPGEELGRAATAEFDPSDGLDERELVAVALTLNPDLGARRLEIGAARALLVEASLWPNPQLGVAWRPGIGGAAGHTLDVDLLLALLRPGGRAARADAATARVEEARAEIVAAEWALVRDVRVRRLDVFARERDVALLEETVELRGRALALVRRGRELGETKELDVSAAELELAEVRRDLRRAQSELETARRELNRAVGLPPDRALRLTAPAAPLAVTVFEDVEDDELDRRLLAGRFELRALESAYARAESELRAVVAKQFPDLKIGPSFSRESGGDRFLGVGAEIELPVFDRAQGAIAEKAAERERARADYVARLFDLRAQAHEARAAMRRAKIELDAQDADVMPLVKRGEELLESALRARELNVLDWVAGEERALRARQAHLESVVRYQKSVVEFEAATGWPLASPPPGKSP